MSNLTDGAIRHALKRVEKSRKQESLTDGEGRGTGRLVLILKPMPTRVTAEWMAQQWRNGRRTKSKIGSYPAMSLSEAREIFKRDFAEAHSEGQEHQDCRATAALGPSPISSSAYVTNLKESGKSSWPEAERGAQQNCGRSRAQSTCARYHPRRRARSHPPHL